MKIKMKILYIYIALLFFLPRISYSNEMSECYNINIDLANKKFEQYSYFEAIKFYENSYVCALERKHKIIVLASLIVSEYKIKNYKKSNIYLKNLLFISPKNSWAEDFKKNHNLLKDSTINKKLAISHDIIQSDTLKQATNSNEEKIYSSSDVLKKNKKAEPFKFLEDTGKNQYKKNIAKESEVSDSKFRKELELRRKNPLKDIRYRTGLNWKKGDHLKLTEYDVYSLNGLLGKALPENLINLPSVSIEQENMVCNDNINPSSSGIDINIKKSDLYAGFYKDQFNTILKIKDGNRFSTYKHNYGYMPKSKNLYQPAFFYNKKNILFVVKHYKDKVYIDIKKESGLYKYLSYIFKNVKLVKKLADTDYTTYTGYTGYTSYEDYRTKPNPLYNKAFIDGANDYIVKQGYAPFMPKSGTTLASLRYYAKFNKNKNKISKLLKEKYRSMYTGEKSLKNYYPHHKVLNKKRTLLNGSKKIYGSYENSQYNGQYLVGALAIKLEYYCKSTTRSTTFGGLPPYGSGVETEFCSSLSPRYRMTSNTGKLDIFPVEYFCKSKLTDDEVENAILDGKKIIATGYLSVDMVNKKDAEAIAKENYDTFVFLRKAFKSSSRLKEYYMSGIIDGS